jgi:hypothetical protein
MVRQPSGSEAWPLRASVRRGVDVWGEVRSTEYGASVSDGYVLAELLGGTARTADVDSAGLFVLSGLKPGRYLLTAFASGHKPSTSFDTLLVDGKSNIEQNFILQPESTSNTGAEAQRAVEKLSEAGPAFARTVVVRVTGGSRVQSEATVTVLSTGPISPGSLHLEDWGGCTWTVNDSDRYVAWVEAPGHRVMYVGDPAGWLADQTDGDWSVVLTPASAGPWSISGSVIGSGAGSWIEATSADGRIVSLAAVGSAGGYRLQNLTSGVYVLWYCQVGQPARMLGQRVVERRSITQGNFSMRWME